MSEKGIGKNELFESMQPARALAVMAVPTIASQLILLIYNLADTWFIGRTGNPYMLGGVSLAGTIYMVPLIAYNYGDRNFKRMDKFASLGLSSILGFSVLVVVVLRLFAQPFVGAFIADEATVRLGILFIRGRCLDIPFMMLGFFVVYYMNAIGKGGVSFFLSILRHMVLLIPIMLIMDRIIGMDGLIWSPLASDVIGTAVSFIVYLKVSNIIHNQ